MVVKTSRLSKESRLVIPANVRKHLDLSPGDVVAFLVEGSAVRIVSSRALRTAVWANNRGGEAGDSTRDVREQRIRDQKADQDSAAAMEAADHIDRRTEDEITADLMAQLA